MSKEIKEWEEISREEIFRKFGRGIEKVKFRLPNEKECDFYLKKEDAAVCILALTKDNEVILVRQFRPGPQKILLEIPGGSVEKDEDKIEAAERELLEETGFKGNPRFVSECFDCAYSTMQRYCMVATDCEKIAEQNLDESEFAEVVLLPLDEFRDLLRSGQMTDVEVGYLGLDFLGLL